MMKIVLVTGGFDPIHSGHISYLTAAKQLGNLLCVGINSDEWLKRKKGKAFLPLNERGSIVYAVKGVDFVIDFDDSDDSAKDAIRKVRTMFPSAQIVFANGGDRTRSNIPEMDIEDPNLQFAFGVGGTDKINSSSWILKNWEND